MAGGDIMIGPDPTQYGFEAILTLGYTFNAKCKTLGELVVLISIAVETNGQPLEPG